VYVARLAADLRRLEWVWLLKGHRTPPQQLWQDRAGSVYFQVHGLTKISADGRALKKITRTGSGGRVGVRAVDPRDGSFYYGGDNNTRTGREPWRRPYLYKCDPAGKRLWGIWGWDPRRVGSDRYRLVSDSSPRCGLVARNGDLVIGGWSDGGNSVFSREPGDLDRPHGLKGFGMTAWGMKGANSLGWLMRIDPAARRMRAFSLWVGYIPMDFKTPRYRGAPNGCSIRQFAELADGSLALVGGAGTGLIQTPNAFYKYAGDGEKHGGSYVAVFSGDFAGLRFSSYLPGCDDVSLAATRKGLVVVSRSSRIGGYVHMGSSPTIHAAQKHFGGAWDGHILLLESPSR
jgi:hypothetical protein